MQPPRRPSLAPAFRQAAMEDLALWLIWIPAGLTLLVLMINAFFAN
jgi:hypothetical protein